MIPKELIVIFAIPIYPIRSEMWAKVGWGRNPGGHDCPEFCHPAGPVLFDGRCRAAPHRQEWLKFPRRFDGEFPPELPLHLVMDNYGTHKEPHVQAWLKKHPRFVYHFVPTRSSWLNLVERWFRELTEKTIRRGSFASVPDLKQAIEEFLRAWNQNPKPFIWTASVGKIIEKIERARVKMEQINPGSTLPRRKKKGG